MLSLLLLLFAFATATLVVGTVMADSNVTSLFSSCIDTTEKFELFNEKFVDCSYTTKYLDKTIHRCNQQTIDENFFVKDYCPLSCEKVTGCDGSGSADDDDDDNNNKNNNCKDVEGNKVIEIRHGVFVGCWYPKKYPELTESRCNQQTINGSLISDYCPVTCKTSCSSSSTTSTTCDDVNDTFELRQGVLVGCWYPKKYPELTESRCEQKTYTTDQHLVSYYCPKTCNTCPSNVGITYHPGDLTVKCEGLILSTGLQCKKLTTGGQPVLYTDGTSNVYSNDIFHSKADGATVIPHPNDGGWYYVSNSESSSSNGGVGSIRFNSNGDVIEYKRILSGTNRNCGGGRTYWNTWVTCEESGREEQSNKVGGWVWEVDPYTGFTQATGMVGQVSGNYESMAYDDKDPNVPIGGARFYITEDEGNGQLTRYTPCDSSFNTGNYYDILSNKTCVGTTDYLVLLESLSIEGITYGTFTWTSNLSSGRLSASTYFRNCEGIDIKDRLLYMTCKTNKQLYILDLAKQTYEMSSTVSGAFNNQPDQVARILNNNINNGGNMKEGEDNNNDILYFCEDGGKDCDIHGRDSNGNYFTILTADGWDGETTGLAFSIDGKHMYFAIQGPSIIFDVWRDDNHPFHGDVVDIKYHSQ